MLRNGGTGYDTVMTNAERTFHEPDDEGNIVDTDEVAVASGATSDPAEKPEHPTVGNDNASAGEGLSGMGGTSGSPSPTSGAQAGREG